jgi:hypothetical protein
MWTWMLSYWRQLQCIRIQRSTAQNEQPAGGWTRRRVS